MPEAIVRLRAGEKRPIYGQAVPESGETVTLAFGATYTLFDAAWEPVVGHSAQPVTGYDTGAQSSPRVWVVLDTLIPVPLVPGYYTLVFAFDGTGSDGIARSFRVSVGVAVSPAG